MTKQEKLTLNDISTITTKGVETISFIETKTTCKHKIRKPLPPKYELPYPSQLIKQIIVRPTVYFSYQPNTYIYELFIQSGFKSTTNIQEADLILTHKKLDYTPNSACYINYITTQQLLTHNYNLEKIISNNSTPISKFLQTTYFKDSADLNVQTMKDLAKTSKTAKFFDLKEFSEFDPETQEQVNNVQLVQQNQLLVSNKRFFAECFVIVTSTHPLRIYLFKEQLVYLCEKDFDTDNITQLNYVPINIYQQFEELNNEIKSELYDQLNKSSIKEKVPLKREQIKLENTKILSEIKELQKLKLNEKIQKVIYLLFKTSQNYYQQKHQLQFQIFKAYFSFQDENHGYQPVLQNIQTLYNYDEDLLNEIQVGIYQRVFQQSMHLIGFGHIKFKFLTNQDVNFYKQQQNMYDQQKSFYTKELSHAENNQKIYNKINPEGLSNFELFNLQQYEAELERSTENFELVTPGNKEILKDIPEKDLKVDYYEELFNCWAFNDKNTDLSQVVHQKQVNEDIYNVVGQLIENLV